MSTGYIGNVKAGPPLPQPMTHWSEETGQKTQKLSWWRRWFMKQSKQAWEDSKTIHYPDQRVSLVQEFESPQVDGMHIRVYGATGGNIVEFRRYDTKTDRNNNKLYVIPTEQNFVESFSKIVSMEMIR